MISTFEPSASQKRARRARRRAGVGAVGRRQDAPAVVEQRREARVRPRMLGAGDRMGRHEMHALRADAARSLRDHRALDRADVRHDRAGLQRRRDRLGHRRRRRRPARRGSTRSAPCTASAASVVHLSARPSSRTRVERRLGRGRSRRWCAARFRARAARAIDEPISPMPIEGEALEERLLEGGPSRSGMRACAPSRKSRERGDDEAGSPPRVPTVRRSACGSP